jgi:predicted kinase
MTQWRVATLHFIFGKPGAGKTTLARELGRTEPAVVFCEDEWVSRLGFEIRTFDDFRAASARVRGVIGPHVVELLRLGVSVVFDFGGNMRTHRAWTRGLFEAAGADHLLHVIDATDEECLARVHRRNTEQPEGVYWGHVTDEIFRAVLPYIAPPAPDEGFRIAVHRPA